MQFSAQFADEYIDGYQVAYSVLTNIDDLVRMQREQSVTYDSLPGFVAKYRIEHDLQMTLLEANARFMKYFGSETERGGNSLCRKNIADNIEAINANREQMLAGEPLHFVMRVQSRQGQTLWLQVNASCIDWQEGCPVYLAIFIDITDVTELREMQKKLTAQTEALKDALAVAKHANRAKSTFLSRMSHEIRTPMNAIIGMTTIAAAYIDDRSRVEDCLEKIGYSSKHLMALINDVLDMFKIDEGKMTIAHEVFNLETVIGALTPIIYPQAVAKNLVTPMGGTISVQSEPEQGSVFTVELDFDIPADKAVGLALQQQALQALKVMIADNDRDSCLHTSLLLKNLGIMSSWVTTGRECVEKVNAAHQNGEDYDVCLIDWQMPDIDGIEVTKRVREFVGPETLIIIITVYDWNSIEKIALGLAGFLSLLQRFFQ